MIDALNLLVTVLLCTETRAAIALNEDEFFMIHIATRLFFFDA